MEIIVKQNSISVKNLSLDKEFSGIIANLLVDRLGRVKVYTGSDQKRLSFYTTLEYLPSELLLAMSEKLENEASNRVLVKIKKRIEPIIKSRALRVANMI
jgi:hypothetical protein